MLSKYFKIVAFLIFVFSTTLKAEDISPTVLVGFAFTPAVINSNFGLMAGAKVEIDYQTGFSFYVDIHNLISRNIKAPLADPIAKVSPSLELNCFSLGVKQDLFGQGTFVKYSAGLDAGLGKVKYKLTASETSDTTAVPDFGLDWFYFVSPNVNARLNIFNWFNLDLAVGYRTAIGVNYAACGDKLTNGSLSGVYGNISLVFGMFK